MSNQTNNQKGTNTMKRIIATAASVAFAAGVVVLAPSRSSAPTTVTVVPAVQTVALPVIEEAPAPIPQPEAPVVAPSTTAVAPAPVAPKPKPRIATATRVIRATTPTTLDPNEIVWVRDGRGYCGQTSRASADPAAIDSSCPANQPAPLEGHAANPTAEDENSIVYVYEDGYCKPMGRAEAGQEHNSPECVGYTEGKQYWYVDPTTGQPTH